ncbi:family 20 glycosylhydrolase [Erysipelothrix rhusiopathiae]|uniref:family 20 glycosylhydrolase n=1 Tax=Erysipelothrix rhusiopathiae TaxID=1648 RepID=UPI0013E33A11|nr:family 20 glycosylhydrolase [Erysipelothrix rhusiopathiae]
MKKLISILILCLVFVISAFNQKFVVDAFAKESTKKFNNRVVPVLKEYNVSDEASRYRINDKTRFILENKEIVKNNKRLQDVIRLAVGEMIELRLLDGDTDKLFMDINDRKNDDIVVVLSDLNDISDSSETYRINIDHKGIVVEAASENAVLHALRTIIHLSITENGLYYGNIIDFPDLSERRLHVDMGRKYFTKDWLIQQIKEMSYFKMNAIQLHFSENMGYRIESEFAPEIVSEEYLTKQEIKDIIEIANLYGVSVIPSFDTPGHTKHILKSHPEFGQIDVYGNRSDIALDVTNKDAINFVYGLLDEIMELFDGSEHIHLGADEYMEFDRPPFTTNYIPVLNDFAKQSLGDDYNWKDVMATYINNLSKYVYDKGFKPRVWNDGMYYGENPRWCSGGAPQKVEMHKYIGIDFWSQMSWNPCIAKLNTFIDKDHADIYNVNASYFYYVLRPSKPNDGRNQHSFDYLNQDIRIFESWTPGKFQENIINDDNSVIRGASLAIWNDLPNLVGEDIITEDISKELRSLATKSWNSRSNQLSTIDAFRETYRKIGHVATFEKGLNIKETSMFKDLIKIDALQSIINHAIHINQDKFEPEGVRTLNNLILLAKREIENLSISNQEEIDNHVENIEKALANLVPIEDKPIEDKPIEDKPIEDKPIEDKQAEKEIVNIPKKDDKAKINSINQTLPNTGINSMLINNGVVVLLLGIGVVAQNKSKNN